MNGGYHTTSIQSEAGEKSVVGQFDVVAASLSVSRRTKWRRKAAATAN
jgi:hypothetical protein